MTELFVPRQITNLNFGTPFSFSAQATVFFSQATNSTHRQRNYFLFATFQIVSCYTEQQVF